MHKVFSLPAVGMALFSPPAPAVVRSALRGPGEVDAAPAVYECLQSQPVFQPVPRPGPDDWLATHLEKDQSFIQYSMVDAPTGGCKGRAFYLQPLGLAESDEFIAALAEAAN